MAFVCLNEIEILGGASPERAKAAELILAFASVDELSLSRREEGEGFLRLRVESEDGLPEEELAALAPQFPELSFTLVYFSLDGEFYGYARRGAAGEAAESADFDEGTRDLVGRGHEGDGIAFVRSSYRL
jgi:hypothetical protein